MHWWDIYWRGVKQTWPILVVMMVMVGSGLRWAFWRDSKITIRRYAFRADLMIQKGCPTIYQGCHVIIPARSLDQAKEIAERMGNLNETSMSYDPEFRHG